MQPQQPTLVFDWNCTLLDDFDLVLASQNASHGAYDKALVTHTSFREQFTMPPKNFYKLFGFTDVELAERLLDIQGRFHDHYEAGVDQQRLRKGVETMFAATRAANLNHVILSNHIEQPIRKQLARLQIEDHFHAVLAYAERATQFKHETKGDKLGRFMAEHNLRGENCVIIGDTAEEIHIARAYGMTSVAITGRFFSTERLAKEEPDHLVHDLHEFHDVLRQRGWVA
jgi:phosphoglycolate phosphatase-like HAD superfamily hydrolase